MTSQRTVDWAAARPPAAPDEAEGLREREQAQTRQLLSDTATRMFLDRGFDAVKVTDIAAARARGRGHAPGRRGPAHPGR